MSTRQNRIKNSHSIFRWSIYFPPSAELLELADELLELDAAAPVSGFCSYSLLVLADADDDDDDAGADSVLAASEDEELADELSAADSAEESSLLA